MTGHHLFDHPETARIGWTLLEFLWQGAAVAAILALGLRLLRDQAAQVRYLAACVALLVMLACPIVTWVSHPDLSARALARGSRFKVQASKLVLRQFSTLNLEPSNLEPPRRPARPAADGVAPLLPGLVAAWLVGVLILSLRLLGGWVVVQRLGRVGTRPIGGPLQLRVEGLARRLGIRVPVSLLESARVQAPAVVGWLRPAILLPVGALTGMPTPYLEALLAHELAHIRRHDYGVNLLQTVVETLLFYHPCVWWVSHRIRVEREHCCDDLAVALLGDRMTYAWALTNLAQSLSTRTAWAMASDGGDLLARVRRILGLPAKEPRPVSASLGGSMIVFLTLAAVLYLHAVPVSSANETRRVQPKHPEATVFLQERLHRSGFGAFRDSWLSSLRWPAGGRSSVRVTENLGAEAGDPALDPKGRETSPASAGALSGQGEARETPEMNPAEEAAVQQDAQETKPDDKQAEERRAREAAEREQARANEERERARAEADRERDRAKAEAKRERDQAKAEAKRERDQEKAEAKREAERSRAEAERGGDQARRAQEEARRALERVRPQIERAMEQSRRAQEEARRQLDRVMPEVRRQLEETRRSGKLSPEEQERMRAELGRAREEIARAREEMRRELERSRPELERAREEVRRELERARPEIRRAIEEARKKQQQARPDRERSKREDDRSQEEALLSLDRIWPEVQRATEEGLKQMDRVWPDIQRATEEALRAAEEALRDLPEPEPEKPEKKERR